MTEVAVAFEWRPVGEIRSDGRPVFPSLPAVPGLYRFAFMPVPDDLGAA